MQDVPVYFYYLDPVVSSDKGNVTNVKIDEFLNFFGEALSFSIGQPLINRKYNFKSDEKITWIDSCVLVSKNDYNLIINSAKYNHVRNIIDTQTMSYRDDIEKDENDGDVELNHVCIRYVSGNNGFVCLHGSNYYGVGLAKIVRYLNEQLSNYKKHIGSDLSYAIKSNLMPCGSFLAELGNLKRINVVELDVEEKIFSNSFAKIANRFNTMRDTVRLVLKPQKRFQTPVNLVKEYYENMSTGNGITRIILKEGAKTLLDTENLQVKRTIKVESSSITNEVDSESFFIESERLIKQILKE